MDFNNEIDIFQEFSNKIKVDEITNKKKFTKIIWDIIKSALEDNREFEKRFNELNLNNINFDKMIKLLIKTLKELYNFSLFSSTKNHFKKFCNDIPKTKSIIEKHNVKNIKNYYNTQFKHLRLYNKDLIINTIENLIKIKINNIINTKALFNCHNKDSTGQIEKLHKEISKLKNLNIQESAKKQNKIDSLMRENMAQKDEIIKLNKIRDNKDTIYDKYIQILETYNSLREKLKISNRDRDDFKMQLELLVNKVQKTN